MRVDKQKNVWKVAEIIAKHPHATEREIAEMASVSSWTAHNAIVELKQSWVKDENIAYIVGSAKARIKKISSVLDRFVEETITQEKLDRRDVREIKDIAKDDLARVTILWWELTDDEGGLKAFNFDQMSLQELDNARKQFLDKKD